MEENFEEPPLRLQIILGVGVSSIGIIGGLVALFIATNFLGLRRGEVPILVGFRMLIVLGYVVIAFPAAVLGEYLWSQTKKKTFKLKRIAFNGLLLGAVLMLMVFLSYIFEILFPNVNASAQVPLLGVSVGLAIIITALIARTPRARELVKKMYD